MRKLFKFLKKNIFVVLVILISIPTFWKMLSYGMYSTQDFHLFRLYEFDKCVKAFQIPCRWAPDAGLGYGEPVFNFYGQAAYWAGEIFHLVGFSFIDSIKIIFVLSLIGSGVAMFFLGRKFWKNDWAALFSSAIYLYAPYRAVDVWVRGALPEALSFVLFPLILLAIENKKFKTLALLLALLILTHNLSALMFLPVVTIWIVLKKYWKAVLSGFIALFISAFYILPVVFESKFVNLGSTVGGFYDFHNHFVTLYQLLISNFWGYGASVWGSGDGLSLAVGYAQWVLPIVALIFLALKKKLVKNKEFITLFVLGWLFLFLTHNKSTFVWEALPFLEYIQFPWRFLGMAVFCFSLAGGATVSVFKNKWLAVFIFVVTIGYLLFTTSYFRPDIWYSVSDSYYLTGAEWDRQRAASIGDFWPKFGHKIPNTPSDGKYINYFPGWNYQPDSQGLIPAEGVEFLNTPVRSVGNIISLVTLAGGGVILWLKRKH